MLSMCQHVVVGHVVPLLLCPHCVVVPVVQGGVVVVWSLHGGGVDGCTVVVLSSCCHVVVGHCMSCVSLLCCISGMVMCQAGWLVVIVLPCCSSWLWSHGHCPSSWFAWQCGPHLSTGGAC